MANNTKKTPITLDTTVNTKELAIVLGLSTRRIQQLVQDGQFEAVKRGRYLLAQSVSRYIEHISKRESDDEKAEAELSIKKAKAIMVTLEAKELQGKMHRSEDVAALTEDLTFTIRGMLLALPGRLAVDVAAASATEPAEIAKIIRKEVHAIMDELSNYQYDPKKYEDRVRERRNWDIEDGDVDEDF